jgi:hypothetical protein
VLAWGRLAELGLASAAGVAMLFDGVTITAPEDPLAAGLAQDIPLYRGPGYVTVADVPPSATVIARGPDGDRRAVVFRYDPGALLATGRPAPGLRIGLFPARPGPAPWLLGETGHAVFAAAVRIVMDGATAGR